MEVKGLKKEVSKMVMLGLLIGAVSGIFTLAFSSGEDSGEKKTLESLGLADFAAMEITYDGVMHELYWHYEFANQMMRVDRIDDAKAHLKVMGFYINLLPYLKDLRQEKFFKRPEDRRQFDNYAQDLLNAINQAHDELGAGDAVKLGKKMEENVSAMCHHCHDILRDDIREITPYGQKISLGKGKKEIKKKKEK